MTKINKTEIVHQNQTSELKGAQNQQNISQSVSAWNNVKAGTIDDTMLDGFTKSPKAKSDFPPAKRKEIERIFTFQKGYYHALGEKIMHAEGNNGYSESVELENGNEMTIGYDADGKIVYKAVMTINKNSGLPKGAEHWNMDYEYVEYYDSKGNAISRTDRNGHSEALNGSNIVIYPHLSEGKVYSVNMIESYNETDTKTGITKSYYITDDGTLIENEIGSKDLVRTQTAYNTDGTIQYKTEDPFGYYSE